MEPRAELGQRFFSPVSRVGFPIRRNYRHCKSAAGFFSILSHFFSSISETDFGRASPGERDTRLQRERPVPLSFIKRGTPCRMFYRQPWDCLFRGRSFYRLSVSRTSVPPLLFARGPSAFEIMRVFGTMFLREVVARTLATVGSPLFLSSANFFQA